MTVEQLQQIFDDRSDREYFEFARIPAERRFSNRPDLNAFILLDRLCPSEREHDDVICAAEHDEFWLTFDPRAIAKVITEEQAIDLLRCGVGFDGEAFHLFA